MKSIFGRGNRADQIQQIEQSLSSVEKQVKLYGEVIRVNGQLLTSRVIHGFIERKMGRYIRMMSRLSQGEQHYERIHGENAQVIVDQVGEQHGHSQSRKGQPFQQRHADNGNEHSRGEHSRGEHSRGEHSRGEHNVGESNGRGIGENNGHGHTRARLETMDEIEEFTVRGQGRQKHKDELDNNEQEVDYEKMEHQAYLKAQQQAKQCPDEYE